MTARAVLTAFALYPWAVLQLTPRTLAHLAHTLTLKETTTP